MIPSLLQIPSAVSDSKLHSVLPNNGKGDFTFDRSTGATRINKDGLIEEVGYFSSELVQNGNFSELGDTVIVNGDMSLSGNITLDINSLGWNTPDTATSNAFISEHKLTIERLNGDARVYATNGVNTRNVLTVGKTYKLIFDIVENDGCTSFFYYRGGDYVSVSDLTLGRKTIYFTAQSNQLFILRNGTNNSSISIDNVSVKQVDPNDRWTLGTGWSYGTNKAEKTAGTGSILSQSNVVEANKKYKVSFDVVATAGYIDSVFIGGQSEGTNITASGSYSYIFDTTNLDSLGFNANSSFAGSVTNISVVEVQGDRPRLSYDITNGVVEKQPHLLLEPSSTNLLTFSEDYTQSLWQKLGLGNGSSPVITKDYAISPDGTRNATRLQCNLNGGTTVSDQSLIAAVYSSSGSQTISLYMKSNTGSNQNIYFANTVTSGDTAVVTSEWQRFTFSHSSSPYVLAVGLRGSTGADNTADILIFAAQAEQQTYATSYIPTAGTTITRAAETCNNSKPSVNSTEGVLYAEIAALADDLTFRAIALSDGTFDNRVLIRYRNSSDNINVLIEANDTPILNQLYQMSDITNFSKIAFKYKSGDLAIWVDGQEVFSGTNTFSNLSINKLAFDGGTGADDFYGKVKGLAVYNEALTDAQLIELTS